MLHHIENRIKHK